MAFRWPWRRRQEAAPERPSGEWRWVPTMRPTLGEGRLTMRTDPPGVLHRLSVVPPGGVAGRASGLVTVSSRRLPGGAGAFPLRHPLRLGPAPEADDFVWPGEVAEAGTAVAVAHVADAAEPAERPGPARAAEPTGPEPVVRATEIAGPVDVPSEASEGTDVTGLVPRRTVPVREARQLPAPLTVAGTEWVGESQRPASPWVPSEFLHNAYREKDRMLVDAYIEENGEAPFVPPSRPVPPPVNRSPEPAAPAVPPVTARRASLAESRRWGIGVTPAPDVPSGDEPTAARPEAPPTGDRSSAPESTQDEPEQPTAVIEPPPSAPEDDSTVDATAPARQRPDTTPPDDIAGPHPVTEQNPPAPVHATEHHSPSSHTPGLPRVWLTPHLRGFGLG